MGIIFKPNGEFNRTDQIKYYENEPLKRRPDNLRGTWRIETVGSHIYLYMVFNKKRHIKFDILKLNDYWLKIKVLQIT